MFKMKKILAGVGSAVLVLPGLASAALTGDAATAMTSLSTFADDMIAAAWPIATAIVVATIGIKLFKKFTSRAS